MPLIGTSFQVIAPCPRCNSKRKEITGKTEKIKNDNGVSIIEHSQIVCTNRKCQMEFESLLKAEFKKREGLRLIRVENSEKNKALRKTAKKPLQ